MVYGRVFLLEQGVCVEVKHVQTDLNSSECSSLVYEQNQTVCLILMNSAQLVCFCLIVLLLNQHLFLFLFTSCCVLKSCK